MTNEPQQAQEQVYAVWLTEDDRRRIVERLSGGSGGDIALSLRIASARPEHPDRQAALERLLAASLRLRDVYDFDEEAVSGVDTTIAAASEFLEALDHLEAE